MTHSNDSQETDAILEVFLHRSIIAFSSEKRIDMLIHENENKKIIDFDVSPRASGQTKREDCRGKSKTNTGHSYLFTREVTLQRKSSHSLVYLWLTNKSIDTLACWMTLHSRKQRQITEIVYFYIHTEKRQLLHRNVGNGALLRQKVKNWNLESW